METLPTVKLCPLCQQPMQISGERLNKNGEVIQRQFLCTCQGNIWYENVHVITDQDKK